jgi:MSHA biogenesis protein MshP
LQAGFAAIAAIFLVVVLAALGGFMLTFSNTEHITSAQDVQGSRAYWAARAGLEWGLSRVLSDPTLCTAAATTALVPTVATPVVLAAVDGFALSIQCARNSYTEASSSLVIYHLTVDAHLAGAAVGSVGYIERSVSASVESSL